MIATIETLNGPVEVPMDTLSFSALRCFASAKHKGAEASLYKCIAGSILRESGQVALYGMGTFLDTLLATTSELAGKISAIIDPSHAPGRLGEIPIITSWESLSRDTQTIFLCELLTEVRWRLRRLIEPHYKVLCPDILTQYSELIPQNAWVVPQKNIYPIDVPAIEIQDNVDVLLLNLPARNNFALPLSLGYVHKALKKISGISSQTLDADAILYHRYHIWRIFDFGENVVLENGTTLATDPWEWHEECWMDPRSWHSLYTMFASDINEIVAKIIASSPKVLALSIHQRNEWIARMVAQRVKVALPDTQILAGGHSCVSHTFGPKAFPEYDYMIIGEAEAVLGPLLRQLIAGGRPSDLPGVVSRNDSSGRVFESACPPQNLDEVGSPEYDWTPDFRVFQTYAGRFLPYLNLTRGCIWGRCTFCAERFPFRTRSANVFVDELERFYNMGVRYFNFSDSDFGGKPEIINEVAEEILRRGLKLSLNGQLRINAQHDVAFLKKMVAAGIGCNFGIDGVTGNTLKLQRKGYTIETVNKCLDNCKEAGIQVFVNLVVGVPGETEQDVEETIHFIVNHKSYISEVFNISPFYLMHGNIYWEEPEKHGIRFVGEKDTIYAKYFHGIPDRYWYSVTPYIDGSVRRKRAYRIMTELRKVGINVSFFAENSVMRPMFDGFQNPRDFAVEVPSLVCCNQDLLHEKTAYPNKLTNYLQDHVVMEGVNTYFAINESYVPILKECIGNISVRS